MHYPRYIRDRLLAALSDTPVVLLNGARQVGKSTLVRDLASTGWGTDGPPRYITLDDPLARTRAAEDPVGLIGSYRAGKLSLVIDEVQKGPELLPAIKMAVDADRRPGQFLLTGSADIFALSTVNESLAGRMEIQTLWSLAQTEIEGTEINVIDRFFDDGPIFSSEAESGDRVDTAGNGVMERVVRGGYPEAQFRSDRRRRDEWFESYVSTILQRDIRDFASIDRLSEMPRLLQFIAARSATLVSYAEFSRTLGIPASTLKRYLTLLEALFLVRRVSAWSSNHSKRLVRAQKIVIADSGLAAALTGASEELTASTLHGNLLETFVMNELVRHKGWAVRNVDIYHFRTHSGQEVDILLQDRKGMVVGVEVKSTSTLRQKDFRHLVGLESEIGDMFHRGIVLYRGREIREYSERITAVPIEMLWRK